MKTRWYLFNSRRGFPVTFHLLTNHRVIWKRVIGVQVGLWFIGAVRSDDPPEWSAQQPVVVGDNAKICPQDGSVCWDRWCDVRFCEERATCDSSGDSSEQSGSDRRER